MNEQADVGVQSSQITAFLEMLSLSEGTSGIGYHGYDCIVGSTKAHPKLFTSYADHPRVSVLLRPGLTSTAAGKFQILARNYDAYRRSLRLPDFSPASQNRIAIQMIREQRAIDDVVAGRVEVAIRKCSNIWASLPGANYGQRTNSIMQCVQWFKGAGGVVV